MEISRRLGHAQLLIIRSLIRGVVSGQPYLGAAQLKIGRFAPSFVMVAPPSSSPGYAPDTSARNTIFVLFLLVVLIPVQIKAISSLWPQSSTQIGLAGQVMSLLSVPKQRSSSSHVGVDDEAWKKL